MPNPRKAWRHDCFFTGLKSLDTFVDFSRILSMTVEKKHCHRSHFLSPSCRGSPLGLTKASPHASAVFQVKIYSCFYCRIKDIQKNAICFDFWQKSCYIEK